MIGETLNMENSSLPDILLHHLHLRQTQSHPSVHRSPSKAMLFSCKSYSSFKRKVQKQILCLCIGGFFFFFLVLHVKDFMPILWFCQKGGGEVPAQEVHKDQQQFPELDFGLCTHPKAITNHGRAKASQRILLILSARCGPEVLLLYFLQRLKTCFWMNGNCLRWPLILRGYSVFPCLFAFRDVLPVVIYICKMR